MLEMLEIGIDNAVAIRISGKITEGEMSVVLDDARAKIDQFGNIVIFEQIDSFSGIEMAALVEEFKYAIEVGLSNIVKAAVVTDKKWLEVIVNIEDKIFRNIEMRCFSSDEREAAIAFLRHS